MSIKGMEVDITKINYLSQGRIQGEFVGFVRNPLGRTPNREETVSYKIAEN